MKKLTFPMAADILFYSFCAFLLSTCILRYYRVPLWLTLTAAILFALATGLISFLLLYSKNKKKLLTKREREARDALKLHLALEKPEKIRAALLAAFLADGKEATCGEEGFLLEGAPAVPIFKMEAVTADEIAQLIRRFGATRLTVVCNDLSAEAEKLLASFGGKAMRGDEVYALFVRTETTPSPLICGEVPRRTVKSKLRRSFSKANARPFLVSGALLLFMSLFTFFPLYYILSGSALLLASVAVRIFGYAA